MTCGPGQPAAGLRAEPVVGSGSVGVSAVSSLLYRLGRGRRVKAKPLRGRCASLDTPASARRMAAIEGTREKQGMRLVQADAGPSVGPTVALGRSGQVG